MPGYLPVTKKQRQEMFETIGVKDFDGLCVHIDDNIKLKNPLDLPKGKTESCLTQSFEAIANKNKIYKSIFRGAGAYNHFIPSVVKHMSSREEFVTAYTPYQAEMSQGILQSIFEFQTDMCELTGLDVSNASVYDGATAAAEAVIMCADRKRSKVIISGAVNPATIEVIKTYNYGNQDKITVVPAKNGMTDMETIKSLLDKETACVYLEQPNYFGNIEDCEAAADIIHEAGAKFIMGINPVAAALLKTPGECGADIAVGEAQPFGLSMAFGGPYLGFMVSTKKLMRKLPGRIVGETVDKNGVRCFVLTLQAREQHIRREKSLSSICSNESLCAIAASVYLGAVGPQGLSDIATSCHSKAVYMANEISKIPDFSLKYDGEFFHEFVVTSTVSSKKIEDTCDKQDILSGLVISDSEMLWCTTEMCSKEDIDSVIKILQGVAKGE